MSFRNALILGTTLLGLLPAVAPGADSADSTAHGPGELRLPPMTQYVLGLYRRGPQAPAPGTKPTPDAEQLQAAHLAHLGEMAASKRLVGAGPILDDGALRGILIFKGGSVDSVRAIAMADPKVKAGWLTLDLHPWMGPQGIGDAYAAAVRANPQAAPKMITLYLALLSTKPAGKESHEHAGDLQAAHLANISRLLQEKTMSAAGPLLDGGELRGIFVFRVPTLKDAQQLVDSDPAVKAGVLSADLHAWMVADGVMP